jgi:hypothetical protein
VSGKTNKKERDMKLAVVISLAVAFALASGLAEAKQGKKHVVRTAPPEHVACTKYGCYPIARNCRPQTQYDFWGNPTGYDAIACR